MTEQPDVTHLAKGGLAFDVFADERAQLLALMSVIERELSVIEREIEGYCCSSEKTSPEETR